MATELERTMGYALTVGQLRELLEDYSADTKVGFAYNYGDYWKTTVVDTVKGAEEYPVTYSAYHSMLKLDTEEVDYDEETGEPIEKDTPQMLVIYSERLDF